MLSPLLDNVNSEIQLLVPVMVASSAVSAWRSAVLELKNRRCSNKKDMFVVEVFQARSDPTFAHGESIENGRHIRRPIAKTKRTLLKFVQFVTKSTTVAHETHHGKPCDLCIKFMELIAFRAYPDGFIVGRLGGNRLKRTMMKFMVELYRGTNCQVCINTRGCCSG
ncbi:hypothetical protein DD237_007500 [Peronospora effusa]|uniref:Uncharacterized protein n=1 Tax=Peronospora effusa TaxID=542832 RepID=A0A425CP67_9STRA|nr:hypothetical protein DD237_007500 [Peronospora effusa]